MAGLKKNALLLGLLGVLLSLGAYAQDEAETVEAMETEEPAAAEPAEMTLAADASQGPEDVWWGNRSVTFRNYIPFEKIEARPAAPDEGPMVFDKIFFDLDKAVLRPEGRAECDKIVAYLNRHPDKEVMIQGHTCDLASDAYNIALGDRRANAVRLYLIEHGIGAERLHTHTYGETQPWVGLPQRQLNRRAVVIVIN